MDYFAVPEEGVELQAKMASTSLREVQAVIFAMIGGGMFAMSAIRDPGHFYIDDRVGGHPYAKRTVYQAVKIYARAWQLERRTNRRYRDPI